VLVDRELAVPGEALERLALEGRVVGQVVEDALLEHEEAAVHPALLELRLLAEPRGDPVRHHGRFVMGYRAALGDRDVGRVPDRPEVLELAVFQGVLVDRHPAPLVSEARILDHLLAAVRRH